MAGISPKKIAIVDAHYPDYEAEQEILAPFQVELVHYVTGGNPGKIAEAVETADAVLVREMPISRDIIASMSRCKVIVRYGVGVDNIDLQAAKERKIFVANVPNYGTDAVSDHALALMLAVARRVVQRDKAVRKGVWGVGASEPIYSFRDRVLGLIGYGRIGQAVHKKASVFGFSSTLIADPYLESPPEGADCVDLDVLCRNSDVVSLHAPLNEKTYHLLDREKLGLLKPTAILVNTSRGGLIEETALVDILRQKKILGAGIDVFESEPPAQSHPLFSMDNVVLTDHTAWYSQESLYDLQKKAAQEVARVFKGEVPRCWVNRWKG